MPLPPSNDERSKLYLDFIRKVSPEADPTSIMLFVEILRANHRLVQSAEKQLETTGLSWAKFRLLSDLLRSELRGMTEGVQPSELSEMEGISRNTISALIAGLEEDGLISRELHSTDRRKFVIRLTPKGRRVLESKVDGELRFVTSRFDVLNAGERETLLSFLTRLNTSLSEKTK